MSSLIGGHFTKNGLEQLPARVVLSINGNGLGGDEIHPDTLTVFRSTLVFPDGEAPPDFNSFQPGAITWDQYGRYWYQERTADGGHLKATWDKNPASFYQILNEQGGGEDDDPSDGDSVAIATQRAVDIERAILPYANTDGKRCAVLNLAGGSPGDFELWKSICAPFIMWAWENGRNVYARHCYADKFVDANGQVMPGQPARVIAELEYLRSLGYGGGVILSECGLFGGYGVADYAYFEWQVRAWEAALLPYSDILIGLCWWEFGHTEKFQADYTNHFRTFLPYLQAATLPRWQPKTVEEPMDKHKAIVVKVAQNVTAEEWQEAAVTAYPFRHTITASHDDMMTILAGGNEESFVKFAHPDRDEAAVDLVEDAGYAWQPLYEVAPVPDIEIIDIVDQLPKHATLKYATRPLDGITTLTIHHTVSPPDRSIDSIAAYHISPRTDAPNGWPGIAYHFVLKDDGRTYLTNRLETNSYHAGSAAAPGDENAISIGIALQGDFTNSAPPQAQQDAARALVAYLRGLLPSVTAVLGHRQMPGASTACPGATWAQWLPYVAGSVAQPEPPPPPPPPADKLDMLPFLRGDGRIFEMQHFGGGQERNQVRPHESDPNAWYIAKGENEGHWELWRLVKMVVDGVIEDVFCLDTDTSPANASDGTERYYKIRKAGGLAPKYRRFMAVGETFGDGGHTVQFYRKSDCQPHPENSGAAGNVTTIVALHEEMEFANGVVLQNVLEVQENSERQFWCAGYGRVKWISQWGSSQISEEHGPGQRPDIKREVIGCL